MAKNPTDGLPPSPAHDAVRQAIEAAIAAPECPRTDRRLRDTLHALSALPTTRREVGKRQGRPKKRKAETGDQGPMIDAAEFVAGLDRLDARLSG